MLDMRDEAGSTVEAPASAEDSEMAGLIESWRYRGEPTPWDAIVGHAQQVARCREAVEKLSREPADLARLRVRVGAGMVITGPAGTGKTLLARAFASATGRAVIVPPTGELDANKIGRLYARLVAMEPTVVILDEAEGIIGRGYLRGTDTNALRALLAALDGVNRPQAGPVTIALTTHGLEQLDDAAIRPGRLAPRLALDLPTPAERLILLERAMDGLPRLGAIDLGKLVERSAGWSGAELAGLVHEACSRSLVDHSDALRMDLLLQVVGERYTVTDEEQELVSTVEATAIHEAGHAIYAELTWPGELGVVKLGRRQGTTEMRDLPLSSRATSADAIREVAEMGLAGRAAELLVLGTAEQTADRGHDEYSVTSELRTLLDLDRGYSMRALEGNHDSSHGSERMRSGLHAEIEAESRRVLMAATLKLAPYIAAIQRFAATLLDHPERVLSGDELQAALDEALATGNGAH